MLAVSSARCLAADADEQRAEAAPMETVGGAAVVADLDIDFDFTVDDIDFGDFFLRLEDGDALPDLEVDPADIFTDLEAAAAGVEELQDQQVPCAELLAAVEDVGSVSSAGGVIGVENTAFAEAGRLGDEKRGCNQDEVGENMGGGDRPIVPDAKSPSSTTSSSTEAESRHKSSSKNSHGKKKAKVDWTPELHRRFVQAVEQLGIDKAVPSRILEIMGINSLTRHNIASHLQLAVVARVADMLAVSSARCLAADADEQRAEAAPMETVGGAAVVADLDIDFDFTVDDIDFGDFFLRLEDGDALPDLEVDPADIFTDLEAAAAGVEELQDQQVPCAELLAAVEDVGSVSSAGGVIGVENTAFAEAGRLGDEKRGCNQDEVGENMGGGDRPIVPDAKSPSSTTSSSTEAESRHKSSSKNSHGKKKAKVDWTPELHRRFVQAVEQLGIDKAVPSRILEIMGINSLTRHNIASHLQKYRSHRKHMIAREAEAASWTQRRQMYAAGGPAAAVKRQDSNMWTVPTISFAPPHPAPPPPPPAAMQHYARPLHVWGHPTMDSPRMPMWPRHPMPRAPMPAWAPPPPPPSDPAFWHHPYMRGPAAYMPTHGTPCMAMPMAPKFPAPPVPVAMPCPVYTPPSPAPALASKNQQDSQLQLQAQPSNESIDAAIGDVLSKPWLPLPLGLKPPSLGSVMGELERQGVANVPQACG